MTATTAYAMADLLTGESTALIGEALAAPKSGGILKVSMRVQEMTDPATFPWTERLQRGALHRRVPDPHQGRQHHRSLLGQELGGVQKVATILFLLSSEKFGYKLQGQETRNSTRRQEYE